MAETQETAQTQQWKNEAIAVPLGTTGTLQDIKCPPGASTCTITVENATANAFDAFAVSIRPTVTSPFVIHANAAGDFTSPVLPMRYASASPVLLPGTGSSPDNAVIFKYDVNGIDTIRIAASNATAIGSANLYYSFGA